MGDLGDSSICGEISGQVGCMGGIGVVRGQVASAAGIVGGKQGL